MRSRSPSKTYTLIFITLLVIRAMIITMTNSPSGYCIKHVRVWFSMTPVFSLCGKMRVRENPHSNINLIITTIMSLFILDKNLFTVSNTANIEIMKINNKKRQDKELNLFN